MNVLVTGANGHIGSHVVRSLLEAGHTPIGYVRPGSDRRALAGVNVELREGELTDVARAMTGISGVIHVAAVHKNALPEADGMLKPAVEGTRAVFAAAAQAGVKRLVLTSTAATVGFTKDLSHPLDESHQQQRTSSQYISAKVQQERLALALGKELGIDVVVLNPSGVFGPRDYRLTPATRAIIGLLQGDPAFLGVCITDVRDVGRAHALALEKGRGGERYLVTGDPLQPKQVATLFGELSGIKPPAFKPPMFLLRFIVGRAEKKALRDGTDPPTTLAAVDDVDSGHLFYDSSRSKTELGMTYRPARDVLRDTFRWLLHVKALKPKVDAKMRATLGAGAAPDGDWPA